MITPRPYQTEAELAVYDHLQKYDTNPCVEIPTAGGKSLIMAMIAARSVLSWGGRVMVTAHVKELLEQNKAELEALAPELAGRIGIFSAGLGEKDPHKDVTIAGVQSAYRHPNRFGKIDLVLVDEAHLIPIEGEGMYRTLIAGLRATNPALRVIGFTATPYRMSTGLICHPDNILNRICYVAGVRPLIEQGYLCRPITKSVSEPDTKGWRTVAGEFNSADAEAGMADQEKVRVAIEMMASFVDDPKDARKSVLVFTQGKDHADMVMAELTRTYGAGAAGFIWAETEDEERAELIRLFKEGALRFLVNINVLTTGFNARNVDCVVVLRATLSPGLWYQMCGRGFRLFPGKANCLVLDYGGNALRHGPVDEIETDEQNKITPGGDGEAPRKVCPVCCEVVWPSVRVCPACGYAWPIVKHETAPSEIPVLTGEAKITKYAVEEISYAVHQKRAKFGEPIPLPTMRVDYIFGNLGEVSEWICFEHSGFPREKAYLWWARRSNMPVPATVEEAVRLAKAGALAPATEVTVREKHGDKFPRIVGYVLGPKPAPIYERQETA